MFKAFSKKQMRVLTWWCDNSSYKAYDAIICDGAVRSGKTLSMSISFIAWSFYRFSDSSFALCGKTVTSLKRNVITPLQSALCSLGFSSTLKYSQNLLEITFGGVKNRYYLFGGRDESSASLIQGMTLSGILFDEVALMPRSFVEQALARCSVDGSKYWFNCNPEHPLHWFHCEWILKAKEKNAYYVHFKMQDNPSLTPQIIRRYYSLYSGAFFERFIEGKWVAASGLVYPMFNIGTNVCNKPPEPCEEYYVSCDYGTVNPSSFGLWGLYNGVWYRLSEYYHDSRAVNIQHTDEEYYEALHKLVGNRRINAVIVDPSAASFIECIRRHGEFRVVPAKNDVADGIRRVSEALKDGRIMICEGCSDIIREFSLYRWDERSHRDVPIKENDHAMDELRYFVTDVIYGANPNDFYALASARG